jgi:uncharacterized membrane protein YagU involved in acid resistance
MSAASAELSGATSKAVQAIVAAGLLAGVMDITAAFLNSWRFGVKPQRVLQAIASGLFGPTSYQGGLKTAALGLFLHFVIAFGAATAYFIASRKLTFLTNRALIYGALYGIAVHLFMSFIVLPLSAFRKGPFSWSAFLTGMVIHIFCVGLPISLMIRRFR